MDEKKILWDGSRRLIYRFQFVYNSGEKTLKNPDALKHVPAIIAKMEHENLPAVVIDNFIYYYNKVISGETGIIYDNEIECVRANEIDDINDLSEYYDAGKKVLNEFHQNSIKWWPWHKHGIKKGQIAY